MTDDKDKKLSVLLSKKQAILLEEIASILKKKGNSSNNINAIQEYIKDSNDRIERLISVVREIASKEPKPVIVEKPVLEKVKQKPDGFKIIRDDNDRLDYVKIMWRSDENI